MKKQTILSFYKIVLSMFVVCSLPLDLSAAEFRRGDNVDLTGEFNDNIFASGGYINARFKSNDDVFIAGGEISYSAITEKDLFLAGGNLLIQGSESQLGGFAGGSISISRSKFREMLIAGGNIRLEAVQVQDDLIVGGGNVVVSEDVRVLGSSILAGGSITLSGHFIGDVQVYGGELHISPTATIEGNLTYRSEKVSIDPQAKIEGKTTALEYEVSDSEFGIFNLFAGLFIFFGILLIPPIAIALMPQLGARGRMDVRNHFWATLGKGTLAMLLIPVGIAVLFLTFVGLPAAIVMVPLFFLFIVLAWSIIVFVIGDQLRSWTRKKDTYVPPNIRDQFGWTFLGGITFFVILAIPILGFVFVFLMLFLGFGTLCNSIHRYLTMIH